MDSLNTILNSGTYGENVSRHNDNNSKIKQAITTLENVTIANKGYFDTLASLQAAFPSPKAGNIAYVANVASSTGYYIYNVVSGVWTATSTEAPAVGVAISNYAQHGYSSSPKTLKQVDDEVVQLAGEVNGIPERESGYINQAGGESSGTSYNRTPYIPIFAPKDLVVTGYESGGGGNVVLAYFFDINKQPLWAYTTGVEGNKVEHLISKETIDANAPNAAYVRVSGSVSTPASISFATFNDVYSDLNIVSEHFETVEAEATNLEKNIRGEITRESGYINQAGGESSGTSYNRTPFIPIFSPKDLIVTGYDGGGTGSVLAYFYDINKQPLWAYTTGVAGTKVKHVISKELIEANASSAAYVRATGSVSTPVEISFATFNDVYNDLSVVAKTASTPKTIIPEFGNRWTPSNTIPTWEGQVLTHIYNDLISRINIAINNTPEFVNATITEIGKDATNVFPIYKIEIKRIAQDFVSGALKKVIIVSGLHGSEYSHPLTTATFIEMLLSDTDDKIITALRDNFHFIIVPSANPWGYNNAIRSNANGVNLNRNFPAGWRAQGTPSDYGDYSGTIPMSEPESQAINSVIQEHKDFYIAIDGHGYSGFEDNPFLQFWTETYDNAYQDSFSNTAMFLTRYAMKNYSLFEENDKIIGKVDVPIRSVMSQNGNLRAYFETQGDGYSTLMELAMRIYGQSATAGGVEISTLNMMSYINLILDVLR